MLERRVGRNNLGNNPVDGRLLDEAECDVGKSRGAPNADKQIGERETGREPRSPGRDAFAGELRCWVRDAKYDEEGVDDRVGRISATDDC